MDLLRLILLIIGLLIVIGVYIKFRSSDDDLILLIKNYINNIRSTDSTETKSNNATESIPDDDDLIPVLTPINDEPDSHDFDELNKIMSTRDRVEVYSQQPDLSFTAVEQSSEAGPETLLVVLNIMSPKDHVFTGEGIHAVMTSAGLTHGEHQIYHYQKETLAVFSIANAIEPGYFELSKIGSLTTPGLAIFLQLPGPMECRQALDTMLEISKRLAKALSGELCDENRSVLTQQTITHLKDKVESYRVKQQVAQRKHHH